MFIRHDLIISRAPPKNGASGAVRHRPPVDDGVLATAVCERHRVGDSTDLAPPEPFVHGASWIGRKDEVELDGVETGQRRPLDGIGHQQGADPLTPASSIDNVPGVGNVRAEARLIRLQVMRANQVAVEGS